ncbi:uncharacterized protein [Miscanthus floridulus]|uniref:uncharacterized protein isoform X1 n=2 Tax=Miscanthus floridulus TaxID=154761 RepID=UPI003458E9F4
MAMAGAAFLRSVAAKTARATPRLPSALEERLQHHGLLPTSSNRIWLSRFSTSTGSTPPTNLRGPQTHNKEVPSGSEWDWAKAAFKEAAPNAAFLLVFSGFSFMYLWLNPEQGRIQANLDAISIKRSARIVEMQQKNERLRAALLDCKRSQIEPRD